MLGSAHATTATTEIDDHDDDANSASSPSALRELREAKGWTQHELADRAQVHEKTIRRIEQHPERFNTKWSTLKRIADQLGVEPVDLLGREAPRLFEHDPIDPGKFDRARLSTNDVLFIWDLAELLRSSVRTLKRIQASRPWDLPRPIPSVIDQRTRWARVTVVAWLNGDPAAAGSVATGARRAIKPLPIKSHGKPGRPRRAAASA